MTKNYYQNAKPVLKWAGGKTQMLKDILPRVPQYKGKYIEPFLGGGALFFALHPTNAILADSNPELINVYKQIAGNVDKVIDQLSKYKNTEEDFYKVRSLDWDRVATC
jgi:DNA adenine methylase